MATAIPPEAIDKFRRLEARAEAARAKSDALRERVDGYREQERDLRVSLSGYYSKAAVKGRIDIDDEGTVSHIVGDTATVLAERQPTAVRLKKIEARIAETRREQAEHHESASPIFGLVARCREALVQRGWDGL